MKIKDFNYYGFNHDAVSKKFGGDLQFVCEMPIALMTKSGPVSVPCAVYKKTNPDRSKGHKDYAILFSQGDTYLISGRDESEMNWNLPGIMCGSCGDVLLSIDRHHFNQCSCQNETYLDGGAVYQRIGGADLSKVVHVLVDMKSKAIKLC